MSLSPHEQLWHALRRAERPLIVLPELPHDDDVATAFALRLILTALQKETAIVSVGGEENRLRFLPHATIYEELPNLHTLLLKVKVKDTGLGELSYNVEGDELTITLLPKVGAWRREDVNIGTTAYRFDLVIAVGAPDLASLGALGTKYADFFFATPIAVLDHHPQNEHFGAYNLVDVSATSSAEVLAHFLFETDPSLLTPDVATCLFTGMVAKTRSFKSGNVTPRTLHTASRLIEQGARRDEVIEKLYRTRSMETLKLWGRALTRLRSEPERGLVWTSLLRKDFITTGAGEETIHDIVDEVLTTSPEAKVVAVFFEGKNDVPTVYLVTERPHDALALGAPFRATGTRTHARLLPAIDDLLTAEQTVLAHLRKELNQKEA